MQTTVTMIKRTPALNNAPIPYSPTRTMSTPVTINKTLNAASSTCPSYIPIRH